MERIHMNHLRDIIHRLREGESARKWRIRVRPGLQAEGLMLNTLRLPDSGGRWNALSTSRLGGTNVTPEEYLQQVRQAVAATVQ